MSTVNQCFFTDKALYVVVWNLALGEEAVENLQFWLLNIEVSKASLLPCRTSLYALVGESSVPVEVVQTSVRISLIRL